MYNYSYLKTIQKQVMGQIRPTVRSCANTRHSSQTGNQQGHLCGVQGHRKLGLSIYFVSVLSFLCRSAVTPKEVPTHHHAITSLPSQSP